MVPHFMSDGEDRSFFEKFLSPAKVASLDIAIYLAMVRRIFRSENMVCVRLIETFGQSKTKPTEQEFCDFLDKLLSDTDPPSVPNDG